MKKGTVLISKFCVNVGCHKVGRFAHKVSDFWIVTCNDCTGQSISLDFEKIIGSDTAWSDVPEVKKLIDPLWNGLKESVKLQSHYAMLLNAHDGGKRREFRDAEEWLQRLKETKR